MSIKQPTYRASAHVNPRGGNFASLQVFLIISTCFLYLVAAGLFSKAVWNLEMHHVSNPCPTLCATRIDSRSGASLPEEMQPRLARVRARTTSARASGM